MSEVSTELVQERRKPGPKPRPQAPTVGRIVLYTSMIGSVLPAIVTRAEGMVVDVVIFDAKGCYPRPNLLFSEEPRAGHWSWPPRD